jgi:hypothetical protein
MDIPADWISETELRDKSGVADKDRFKFHRNLQNWRHHMVTPDHWDGLPVPMIRWLGVGIGNEAFYPRVFIPIIWAINQLQLQLPGDMNEWRWHLWLNRYPTPFIKWCRQRLAPLAKQPISGADETKLEKEATRKPTKRTDGRRYLYRRLKTTNGWGALMTWAVSVVVGRRVRQSVFDPASPVLAAFVKWLKLDASTVRDGLFGSGIEDMSIDRLLEALDHHTPDQLEQVRIDCLALTRAGAMRSWLWRKPAARAVLVPMLIMLRRSPDHQLDLAAALGISAES